MADPLAVWAVEISAAQGLNSLNAQLDAVNARLNVVDVATKKTGEAINKSMLTGAERAAILGAGYAYLAGKVIGFVQAGLAGTAEGERLSIVMQRLNRDIASIFTPAITAVIQKLAQLADWFRNLTGSQQEQIRNMVGMGLAFLGVVTIVPKLISGVAALSAAFKGAFAAHPILMIVSAIAALLVTTEQGRAALGKIGAAMLPLADIAASFSKALEPIARMMGRIVEAAALILTPIIEVVAILTSFIGPVILLTVSFYALGVAATSTFVSMISSISLTALATGTLTGAVWLLNIALHALKAHPIIAILSLIVGIISFVGSLFSKKQEKPREQLTPAGGAMESFEATYARIQQQIAKTDVAQQTRQAQLAELRSINRAVSRPPTLSTPAVVP